MFFQTVIQLSYCVVVRSEYDKSIDDYILWKIYSYVLLSKQIINRNPIDQSIDNTAIDNRYYHEL